MKYINTDKLKQKIKDIVYLPNIFREILENIINELSEEREEDMMYKALKNIEKLYDNQNATHEEIWRIVYDATQRKEKQQNLLKVAIKGDGTEEYGRKIIEYFEKLGFPNINGFSCIHENCYYFIHRNNMFHWEYDLPEGYTEINLKEEEKERSLESRIEAIEQKLKKLSE